MATDMLEATRGPTRARRDRLTVRPLIISLPPDEDWVTVTFLTADGKEHELRTKWLVFTPSGGPSPLPIKPDDARVGSDIELEALADAKRVLFAPQVVEATRRLAASGDVVASDDESLPTSLPKVFSARPVNTSSGTFAYIRIRTFGSRLNVSFQSSCGSSNSCPMTG